MKIFPYIEMAKSELDVTLISDIADEPNTNISKPVYTLGEKQDLDAGIWGESITPYFNSMEELNEWCKTNKNNITLARNHIEEHGEWPETLPWKY